MKLQVFFTGIICLLFTLAKAQEYTIDMSSGSLEITDVNRVTIEGHDGSGIIISFEKNEEEEKDWDFPEFNEEEKKEDRAAGLKMINAKGQTDNTGLGLYVSTEGDKAEITPIASNQGKRYLIKVPNNVKVFYEHNTHNGSRLHIRNTRSEIEASVHYNSVHFENVQGPLLINAVYGKIEGTLTNINDNISLHSTYGLVDLGVPSSANLDIIMKTSYGRMFTDFDINVSNSTDDNCSWCSKKMMGTVNSGGTEVSLASTYSSVYFRKI